MVVAKAYIIAGLLSTYLAVASGAHFVHHVVTEHIHEDRR